MGHEIFYCCSCQVQIRSADFTKGGALKLGDRVCCAKCAPGLLATLPPQEQALVSGEPKTSPPEVTPASTARLLSPSPARAEGVSPALWAGLGALVLVVVLGVVWSLGGTPAREVPRSAVQNPEAPMPPVVRAATPAERRQEEAQQKLAEIEEADKSRRFAPDEIRRRYAEFARDYADTPQGKKIESRLKTTEPPLKPKLAEPAIVEATPDPPKGVEPPKAPEPPKPAPAEPRPPEPAVVQPSVKPPAPPVPKRPEVPEAAKLREAEAACRKAYPPEQAKTPEEKSKLARAILKNAAGSKDAELYVYLREARDLAAKGMDARTALEAIDARAAAFDVAGMAEKVDLLLKTTVKGPSVGPWAGTCLELAEEASELNDYEAAVKLAGRAEALGRAANDRGLVEMAGQRAKEFADVKRLADGLKDSFKTLETNPDDPAANLALGKFVCLAKGDWKRGLPMLVKGSEPAFKIIAERELGNPAEPVAQGALGEAWAAQAERESPPYKAHARARAAEWLGRAIPGLTGPAKASAMKKLAALGAVVGPKAPFILDLGGGARMELLWIKAGTFTMGSAALSEPEHQVTITKGFYLGKTEVTQAQWEAVMGSNPSHWKGPELPVETVAWDSCQDFLKRINERLANQLKGRVAALPTEAEWEYACRAGTKTKWSCGDSESTLGEYAWYNQNSGKMTHAVGQKKPNAWGLYDMQGNVWEWCQDLLGPYSKDAVDPAGPASGDQRCIRGGCWDYGSDNCPVAFRLGKLPSNVLAQLGFRMALR